LNFEVPNVFPKFSVCSSRFPNGTALSSITFAQS
jgi:hypothetical protein